ncbi:hypothetical protein J6590_070696 [Homalodisca vitripennis]|nr:hypothetical protein J6590_070696 [Homalodisca vitripennis]
MYETMSAAFVAKHIQTYLMSRIALSSTMRLPTHTPLWRSFSIVGSVLCFRLCGQWDHDQDKFLWIANTRETSHFKTHCVILHDEVDVNAVSADCQDYTSNVDVGTYTSSSVTGKVEVQHHVSVSH